MGPSWMKQLDDTDMLLHDHICFFSILVIYGILKMRKYIHKYIHKYRHADRLTDRQVDRQADRQTDITLQKWLEILK